MSQAMTMNAKLRLPALFLMVVAVLVLLGPGLVWGVPETVPSLNISLGGGEELAELASSLQIIFLLTILSLAPAILIMLTAFTRVIIVLGFTRSALATQQIPPNQVLVGLAIFITLYIMSPVWTQINQMALQPYLAGEIDQTEALARGTQPLSGFMLQQTREKDLALFVNFAHADRPASPADIPLSTLVPAFVISELKTAFQIGFMIYIPFIVIDMVVASTLMSMGMMMLPPMMISLPFKVLLFVMADGWHLVVRALMLSFGG